MRLILAIGLEPQRKREAQRILVNSSLDIDCDWKSFLFSVIGRVDPSDPVFHGFRSGAGAINKRTVQCFSLRSEAGPILMSATSIKVGPHLELRAQCSSWSIGRASAYSLYIILQHGTKREIVHSVAATNKTSQVPAVKLCDCKGENLPFR